MNISPFYLAGNVPSIEEARVVFLLERHRDEKNFEKIEEIVSRYYKTNDLLLVEDASQYSAAQLIEREREKNGEKRVKLYSGKNIAGWDHPKINEWISNFLESPDVKKYFFAIETAQKRREIDEDELLSSYLVIAEGAQKLNLSELFSPLEAASLPRKKDELSSPLFSKLHKIIMEAGEKIVNALANTFDSITFAKRQDSLIEALKESIGEPKERKIFVILGENHGNPFSSPQREKAIELMELAKKSTPFVVLLRRE